ncbi:MAG: lysophospholipase [Actinomycetota bacterium]
MNEVLGTFRTSDGTEHFTRAWLNDNPRYDVLLVHGLGEHSGRWAGPMSHLVARGASVHTFDVRGHGETPGPRISIDKFEDLHTDISEIAEATAASTGRPWVLYGHSLGGLQSTGYLIDGHSPQPNIAVLSAPALSADVPPILRVMAAIFGRIAPGLRVDNSIDGDQLSKDPAVGEKYFADPLVETKATAKFGKLVFDEQARLDGLHGSITTPTFVIHGADDPLVPPAASAGLAESDSVERKLYPTLRHELHNEPEGPDVMNDVADWIEGKLF